MRSGNLWTRVALVLAPPVLLVVAAACNSEAGGSASAGGSAGTPVAISGAATIVMTDNKYTPNQLVVKAGEAVTLTLENKGEAVHNLRIQKTKAADGKDVATKLLNAKQSETVTFTLVERGTFDFICDVHPADMKGKITVQ